MADQFSASGLTRALVETWLGTPPSPAIAPLVPLACWSVGSDTRLRPLARCGGGAWRRRQGLPSRYRSSIHSSQTRLSRPRGRTCNHRFSQTSFARFPQPPGIHDRCDSPIHSLFPVLIPPALALACPALLRSSTHSGESHLTPPPHNHPVLFLDLLGAVLTSSPVTVSSHSRRLCNDDNLTPPPTPPRLAAPLDAPDVCTASTTHDNSRSAPPTILHLPSSIPPSKAPNLKRSNPHPTLPLS